MDLSRIRILIADNDSNLASRMNNYLRESGFDTRVISDGGSLKKTILEWRPMFIFIDLMYPGCYAQECLRFLNSRNMLSNSSTHVIVLSQHTAELNVRNCLDDGADDFVVKPFKMIDILQRLSLLTQSKKYNFAGLTSHQQLKNQNDFEMVNLMLKAVNQKKSPHDLRLELIQMTSLALKAVRTSVIETNGDKSEIRVTRSSDDAKLTDLKLDLAKYPEIDYVLRTEKPLFVESIEKDSTLAFLKQEVKSIQFDSMMVLPLGKGSEFRGCVSIRMPKTHKKLTTVDIKIAEIAAQLIAMTWKFSEPKKLQKAS